MKNQFQTTFFLGALFMACSSFSFFHPIQNSINLLKSSATTHEVPCLIYISPQTHRLPAPNKTMVNYYWTTNNNSCFHAVTKQYSINGGAWQSSTASPVSPVIFNGVPCTTNNTRVRVIGHIIHLGQPSNQTATSGTFTLPPCF